MRLRFDDVSAPILVPDDPEFLTSLAAAAGDWRFRPSEAAGEPAAAVRLAGSRYEILLPGEEPVAATAVSAACAMVVEIAKAAIDENPSRLCLHCGSVVLHGRLVVFPSRRRAGKSTLVARLAAAGHKVFGDDVLTVSPSDDAGIASGLALRLRLPLPASASRAFRGFVSRSAAAADDRYLYLRPDASGLAPRGAQAPLGAVILLDRRSDGPAFLSAVSGSDVLKALIRQNFARSDDAGRILGRMRALMERLPRFAVHYSDLEEAAGLLERTFASWPPQVDAFAADDPRAALAPAEDEQGDDAGSFSTTAAAANMPDSREPPASSTLLSRDPAVDLHSVDGDLFLAGPDGQAIYHLNRLGRAIWDLLEEPISQDEVVSLVIEGFPNAPPGDVERDVDLLFQGLAEAGLVRPAG